MLNNARRIILILPFLLLPFFDLSAEARMDSIFYNLEKALKTPDQVKTFCYCEHAIESIDTLINRFVNLEKLQIKGSNISRIPIFINKNVHLKEVEIIDDINFKEFPTSLYTIKSLETLVIKNTGISILPPGIDSLKELLFFDFSGEKVVLPSSLAQLSKLNHLGIHAKFRTVPGDLALLRNLEILDISDSQIEYLPSSIDKLIMLKRISLKGSILNFIPRELSACKTLESIDISGAKFISNEYELYKICKINSLKYIIASNLDINFIPFEIENLTNLHWLNLSNNLLEELPQSMYTLKNLNYIDLSHNMLTRMPIWNSENKIKTLNVSYNYIESLDSSFCRLQKLDTLNFSYNAFCYFPDLITCLLGLEVVDLSSNNFHYVSQRISDLSRLKKLNLDRVPLLGNLPLGIFSLRELVELSLTPPDPPGGDLERRGKCSYPEKEDSKNGISNAEVEKIRKALPGCKVIF